MRDIIFRGKRLDNGKWYYGSYLFLHVPEHDWTGTSRGPAKDVHFIVDQEDVNYAVDPDTLGQYTGQTDKNDKRIFEDDILEVCDHLTSQVFRGYVAYKDGSFVICDGDFTHYRWMDYEATVIGNLWDTPQLLEATP